MYNLLYMWKEKVIYSIYIEKDKVSKCDNEFNSLKCFSLCLNSPLYVYV